MPGQKRERVFALDVPGSHVFFRATAKTWMAGDKPGHDE
jgi:hypothetical protein